MTTVLRGQKVIGRPEATRRMGCSRTHLLNLEERGVLHPIREHPEQKKTLIFYDLEEFERALISNRPKKQRKRPPMGSHALTTRELSYRGRVAALAAPLFKRGADMTEIIVETQADPLLIQELYDVWKLGPHGEEIRRRQRQAEEAERIDARIQARERRGREFREWKTKMAQIEASGRKSA